MSSLINGKIHESLVLAFANLFIHWGAKSSLPRFFVVYVRNEIDQASCIVQYSHIHCWLHIHDFYIFRWEALISTTGKWYLKTTYCPSCLTIPSPFWTTLSKFVTWGRRRLSSFPLKLVTTFSATFLLGALKNQIYKNNKPITCNFLTFVEFVVVEERTRAIDFSVNYELREGVQKHSKSSSVSLVVKVVLQWTLEKKKPWLLLYLFLHSFSFITFSTTSCVLCILEVKINSKSLKKIYNEFTFDKDFKALKVNFRA